MKLLNKKIYTTGSIKLFDWWRASGHPRSVHKDANINKVEISHSAKKINHEQGGHSLGRKKIQGLFKDLKLIFPDLFCRCFCQVTEVLVMTILESMQCFGIKRKPLRSIKKIKILTLHSRWCLLIHFGGFPQVTK